MKRIHYWVILLLFACFVGVKFYYIMLSHSNGFFTTQDGDARHYLKIAENLSTYFTYSDNNSRIPSESATWRPPGWPFVLSIFYLITENPISLIILKSLMELGLFAFGLKLLYRRKGIDGFIFVSLFLLLLEPQYLKYSLTFLSESFTAILIFLVAVVFTVKNPSDKFAILFPILASCVVLVHPVAVFFIGTLYMIYSLLWFKVYPKKVIMHGVLFVVLISIWPIRNALVFDKGLYLTVSQGATFSKGWNEKVVSEFNNVDGDLADENLNLKYISIKTIPNSTGFIAKSEIYKNATKTFIKSRDFRELMAISLVKLKSNFNPFPEKPKNTFIDRLAVPFRIIYLFMFFQVLYLLIRRKVNFIMMDGKICLVVLAILIGQSIMSVYIYTGLRFNAVYGITLLFAFLILNMNWIVNKMKIKI